MSLFLIIADRSGEPQIALARGLALADKMNYVAQVVCFCYESFSAAGIHDTATRARLRKYVMTRRKKEVKEQIAKLSASPEEVACVVVWSKDVCEWIDRQCARVDYTAVIKTSKRSETNFYTPSDWRLLRECPAPMLIVSTRQWRTTRSIVAAVDLTSRKRVKRELNHEVIAAAKQFAAALDCPLHLVHALHVSAVLHELEVIDEYDYYWTQKEALKPVVREVCKQHGLDERCVHLKRGPVEQVISSEAARFKAQLVVMGTVGRTGVKARLLGNTAERVLNHLRTDVLALKP